jgi:hypothetical protein
MSPYRKARRFAIWTIVLFIASPLWFFAPIALWGSAVALPLAAFWLAHGAVMMWWFKCPRCGCSPFASKKGLVALYTPWPRRTCAECGLDLTDGLPRHEPMGSA